MIQVYHMTSTANKGSKKIFWSKQLKLLNEKINRTIRMGQKYDWDIRWFNMIIDKQRNSNIIL